MPGFRSALSVSSFSREFLAKGVRFSDGESEATTLEFRPAIGFGQCDNELPANSSF